MEAVIKLDIDELSVEFIDNLKKLFPGRKVQIKVEEEMDATEYIMNNPDYAKELNERIAEYEKTKKVITVKPEDLL
jgi:hypothetical protein